MFLAQLAGEFRSSDAWPESGLGSLPVILVCRALLGAGQSNDDVKGSCGSSSHCDKVEYHCQESNLGWACSSALLDHDHAQTADVSVATSRGHSTWSARERVGIFYVR